MSARDIKRLRELIQQAGMTQRSMAEAIGYPQRIFRYLCSKPDLDVPRFVMLAVEKVAERGQ